MTDTGISKLLALHVLQQALQDAVRPTACHWSQRTAAQRDALSFLQDEDRRADLEMWVGMAGLTSSSFRSRIHQIISEQIDLSRLEVPVEPQSMNEDINDEEVLH